MKRQELARLVAECRPLLKTAKPEQRMRMLKLIREGYRRLKESEEQENAPWILQEVEAEADTTVLSENADYLEEK